MNNLNVNTWQDWEDICKYLMQHIVRNMLQVNVTYVNYGSFGQKQHGVDLVPSNAGSPAVVAQCKHVLGVLPWNKIEEELEKTDSFPGTINHYCVLTTGNRDVNTHDALNNSNGIYIRPNNEKFKVHVFYWDDFSFENIKAIIPSQEFSRFFPSIFPALAVQDNNEANRNYIASLDTLKEFIPTKIMLEDLKWLESWDFSRGYVVESDYSKFADLWLEHNRTLVALDKLPVWLHQGERTLIAKSLLAGRNFYSALGEFVKAINNSVIGSSLPDGTQILGVFDLPLDERNYAATQWNQTAIDLAQIYRQDILGSPAV